MEDISKKLKEMRLDFGFSQERFGKSLGFSKAYIANIETGRTKPSRRFLEAVSGHYGISLDWLLSNNRLLFLIESGIPTLFFIYGFSKEEIDNGEMSLKRLLIDKDYIFIDALNIRSSNRLLSHILNEKGITYKLFKKLESRVWKGQIILVLKNMSLSKIRYSDSWIWSIFNIIKDREIRTDKSYKKVPGVLIILDYPSYLEKYINSFGQYATPIHSSRLGFL